MTPETVRAANPTERIVDACQRPFTDAWAALDEAVAAAVVGLLREGLERHREVVAAAGLDSDPPTGWTERTERLLEYRRAVGGVLLTPLADVLEEPGLAGRIAELFDQALEKARVAVRELPSEVTATWGPDALAPRPTDGLGRRLGKVFARGLSAARKPGRERDLPLRSVAAGHLGRTLAPEQDEAVVSAMSAWAAWSGRLERAWAEWADVALPALIESELPDAEAPGDHWATIRDAAAALEQQLVALLGEVPHAEARATGERRLEEARGALEADVAVAGSFLYGDGKAPSQTLHRTHRRRAALQAWDRDVGARLRLYASILGIMAGATAVQRRVVQRCREGSLSRTGDLLEVARHLRALLPMLEGPDGDTALRERITALDEKVGRTLLPAFGAIPETAEVARAMTEVSDSAVEALLAVVRQAPTSLPLHDPGQEPPSGRHRVEARSLPLQELARQSFDALRIERIRSSTQGLISAIGGVRDDLDGLPEVFSFARDEALRELDSEEEGAEARATELLAGALERMAAALETRVEDLDKAIERAQERLALEISDGSSALLGRVGAGRMHAQLLAARSRVADLVAWVSDRWAPPFRRALEWVRSTAKLFTSWVRSVLAKAAAMLGREPAAKVASARAIQSLAEVEALVEGLPLVYQRLFTLEPISDPALLAGREVQLEIAMERWRRWHRDEGVPLLVRGRQRSGITSFLRVFASKIESEGHRHVAVALGERISDDATLAETLAEAIGVDAVGSLDELAHAIFAVEESSLPAAISVDNLEHLYMRVPTGTDLVERFLTLMAETEPRIFWIGGIAASAWQLVATTEATAVSQVDVMELPPLDAQSVRTAILARHRRSGLDVHYEESVTAGARLRRRLRRMRDKKGFKKLLEDEYFEQLHKASGGYLGLALFLWLQSASFDPDEGVIMSLPRRPDFSVLEQLSLTQNFTLKAFLEHRTLTLEEHDRIFRLPRHESYQVFESLRNRQLIEQVKSSREPDGELSEIEVDLRYRVRPLLTGAVIAHLQGRNIVH